MTNEKFFTCPYCNKEYKTYLLLTRHKQKVHPEITREQLLIDTKYGGIRPTCACGCGEYTNISLEGGIHYNKYVYGHADRVNNNWGHNPKAIKKSIEVRKNKFKSGKLVVWNKGKKWPETFTPEKIIELKKNIYNEERNKKISEKLKKYCNTLEVKKHRSDNMKRFIHENVNFTISSNFENNFIEKFIKPLGIDFIRQYYIEDIKQYCDIFIPLKNIFIECDGTFWHCDERFFPNGPIYETQFKKVEKDKIKDEWVAKNGYTIIHVWEYDIRNNPQMVKEILEKALI